MLKRRVRVPVLGLVAVVVAALLVGGWLGQRSPYGMKHLRTVEVRAKLENPQGLGLADAKDGDEQFTFDVHEIDWSDGTQRGDGDPPCLTRTGEYADAEIGYLDVAWPDGSGSYDQALWIRCL